MKRQFGIAATIGRLAGLLAIFIVALSLDALRPQGDFSTGPLAYNSSVGAPFVVQTPLDFPAHFDLQFDALAKDANGSGFVEGSGRSETTFRLELRRPQRLVLLLFGIDAVPVVLSNHFAPRRWHHLALSGVRQGVFTVSVDGAVSHLEMSSVHQLQSSAAIGSKDFTFRVAQLGIGVGTTALRGQIAHLYLRGRYFVGLPLAVSLLGELLVAFAALWLFRPWLLRFMPEVRMSDIVALAVVTGAVLIGFLANALRVPGGNWAILLSMGAGAIAAAALAARRPSPLLSSRAGACVAAGLIALSALYLFTLPSWIATGRMFERWPLTSTLSVVFAMCIAAIILGACARAATPDPSRRVGWLALLPYLVFIVFALRTDSISAPINALHWEYVVGPIRALREGGWLLWDVPSQYGFLNILIPALLPAQPAVNAFYWFQALTFFAVSATIYRTLTAVLRMHWVVACGLVVAFFFLADPLLIGPAPYPSMSAVRFLWCYVLLAMAVSNFLGPRPSIERFRNATIVPWIMGCLWSAESAIYVTVIFFTPLCLSLSLREVRTVPAILSGAVRMFALPIACAVATFGVVDVVYLIALRHLPDWSMFVAYSRSYGAGYGEREIPLVGPIWVFVSVLFGGAATLAVLRRRAGDGPPYAVATALAAVWIVSSYYLGRAYPVSVIALLPLVVFAVFIIVRAGGSFGKTSVLAVVAVPLLALGMVSTFWNAGAPVLFPKLTHVHVQAWTRLPIADEGLVSLLAKSRITPSTPVVYYDTWVAMPRSVTGLYDVNWLPAPLEQLEEPIPTALRDEVVTRFVMRHRMSGYFIQAKGGYNEPVKAQSWVTLLSHFYDVAEIANNPDYRILRFSLRARNVSGFPR